MIKKVLILLASLIIFGFLASILRADQAPPEPYRPAEDPAQRPLTDEEIAVATDVFGVDDIYYVSNPLTAEKRRVVEDELQEAMSSLDRYAQKSDRALERMITLAAFSLDRKGYHEEADKIRDEYSNHYINAIYYNYLGIDVTDLGDHAPLSQWLADWYEVLEEMLGPTVMEVTHLVDIKILNYGIPVVFHPNGLHGDSWDKIEYGKHFVPFAGVVSFWTCWGVCVGATFGAGAIVFICSPIAEISKAVVKKYIAPPMSDWIYDRATNSN